jgi:hypothetical protein
VAVLCCGGAIVGSVYLFKGVAAAIKPAEDTTSAFIADLETDNYSDAYGMLCADTQAAFTVDQFSQVAQAEPHITSHRITSANVSDVNGRSTATVVAQLTEGDGAVMSHTFALVNENGAWKVCGQPY